MGNRKQKFLLMAMSLLIIGGIGGCQVKPQINPNVTITEQPTLKKEWFKTESLADVKPYKAEGRIIDGQTWTCFSPADSRELAVELLDYRKKLELMNKRMEMLYEKYFNEKMP